ncbi:MAG: FAD-dependent oxidoreductase [Pseudomonadota bacterium]
MRSSYAYPRYPYRRHGDQDAAQPVHHPVIIVGAGLVGLTLAIDLKRKGVPVVVLERGTAVSEGSRSICQAKRTLEIWDRLGAADRMLAKGVTWKVGKVFFGADLLYQFDLLPEEGHRMPAFINLQQYYCEEYLIDCLLALGGEIRRQNEVTGIIPFDDHVVLDIETPDGPYRLACDWLISAEGVRSTIRRQLGLAFSGTVFEDKFLITDVRMKSDFPAERWFWFAPPFHKGQTALMHRQADDIFRIDLQLGWGADVEAEKDPARVAARVRAIFGADVEFDLEWVSVYVFQCRTLERYVHGRVLFVGDAAHQVSPFGARGGNAGVQDADNLAWKLNLVLDGKAPARLLESYNEERLFAARENILHSTRATNFMTPKTKASRAIRDTVLHMAREAPFARALINPGRLSVPAHFADSPLNTPDEDIFDCRLAPGSPASDAPLGAGWFLASLGDAFTAVVYQAEKTVAPASMEVDGIPVMVKTIEETADVLAQRYDLRPQTTYLFRPDQHIAARWRGFDAAKIAAAVRRACMKDEEV